MKCVQYSILGVMREILIHHGVPYSMERFGRKFQQLGATQVLISFMTIYRNIKCDPLFKVSIAPSIAP